MPNIRLHWAHKHKVFFDIIIISNIAGMASCAQTKEARDVGPRLWRTEKVFLERCATAVTCLLILARVITVQPNLYLCCT